MGRYVMVGLASRRILLHPSTEHMVAQVFRLQQPHGGETSMRVSGITCFFVLTTCVCLFGNRIGILMKQSSIAEGNSLAFSLCLLFAVTDFWGCY